MSANDVYNLVPGLTGYYAANNLTVGAVTSVPDQSGMAANLTGNATVVSLGLGSFDTIDIAAGQQLEYQQSLVSTYWFDALNASISKKAGSTANVAADFHINGNLAPGGLVNDSPNRVVIQARTAGGSLAAFRTFELNTGAAGTQGVQFSGPGNGNKAKFFNYYCTDLAAGETTAGDALDALDAAMGPNGSIRVFTQVGTLSNLPMSRIFSHVVKWDGTAGDIVEIENNLGGTWTVSVDGSGVVTTDETADVMIRVDGEDGDTLTSGTWQILTILSRRGMGPASLFEARRTYFGGFEYAEMLVHGCDTSSDWENAVILEGYLAHEFGIVSALPERTDPTSPNTYLTPELQSLTELWVDQSGKLVFQGGGLDLAGVDMTTDIDYTEGFILKSVDSGGNTNKALRMYGTYAAVATVSGTKLVSLEAGEDDEWPDLPQFVQDTIDEPEHDAWTVQFFPADGSIVVPHPFGDAGSGEDPGGGNGPEIPIDFARTFYFRRGNPSIFTLDLGPGTVGCFLRDLPDGRRQLVLKNNLALPHSFMIRNEGSRPTLDDNTRARLGISDGQPG